MSKGQGQGLAQKQGSTGGGELEICLAACRREDTTAGIPGSFLLAKRTFPREGRLYKLPDLQATLMNSLEKTTQNRRKEWGQETPIPTLRDKYPTVVSDTVCIVQGFIVLHSQLKIFVCVYAGGVHNLLHPYEGLLSHCRSCGLNSGSQAW